jgi:Flp pilus assembly protein TadG
MMLPRAVTSTEGVALVEFALVVPVLLLLLAGILDTGRAVNAYVTISNASREGARYASLNPTAAPSAIKSSAVLPHAQQLDSGSINVSVTYTSANVTSSACPVATTTAPPTSSPPATIPVRVDVTYPWSAATFFLPFVGQIFGSGGSPNFCASSTVDTVR